MEPTIKAIEEMNAQQLREAVKEENSRIEGANVVRKGIQILACKVGFFGTWIILLIVHNEAKPDVLWGELSLVLWAGCWWLFHVTKPQPLHNLHEDGLEKEAREVLSQALKSRNSRYMAEREAEHLTGRM